MSTNIRSVIMALLATCTFTLISCEKEVSFNLNRSEKGIVLNALLKEDSTVAARLTFLQTLNEQKATELSDVAVKLYQNDAWLEDLQPKDINGYRYYVGTNTMKRGSHYKITAEIAGYEPVEGEDMIPHGPTTKNERMEMVSTSTDGDKLNISFILKDSPDIENHYRLRIIGRNRRYEPDTQLRPVKFSFKNADFGERSIDGYAYEYDEYYFTDDLFNGKEKEIRVEFFPADASDTGTYQLEVTALTASSYHYLKSKNAAINNGNDPLTEPSTILTNIKNGLGIVGGVAYRRVYLKL